VKIPLQIREKSFDKRFSASKIDPLIAAQFRREWPKWGQPVWNKARFAARADSAWGEVALES